MSKIKSNRHKMSICLFFLLILVTSPFGILRSEDCTVNVPLMFGCTDLESLHTLFAVYETGDMEALRRVNLSYVKSGKCVGLTANETIKVIKRHKDKLVLFKKDGKYLWALAVWLDCED